MTDISLSAIEHWAYCPRQCGLIHVESIWDENVFTLRGRAVHERADTAGWQATEGARVERALPVWSDRLGLQGRADVVEFRHDGTIYPVEYKLGKPPPAGDRLIFRASDLQLCAQAVCLEEMFGQPAPRGAVYHHTTRQRREVELTDELQEEMEELVGAIRAMLDTGHLPSPVNDRRCKHCSLADACAPDALIEARNAWHARELFRTAAEG